MTGRYIKRKFKNVIKWIKQCPYYVRRAWVRKRVKSRDFTVISNNCWAGRCYQYLGMQYLSPTVGLYFFAEDYVKFVSDLRYYFSLEPKFISAEESKYCEILKKRNQMQVPVGKLDDIEVIFLHYHSAEEAKNKWERRKKRVNYDNIFIKFSNMNLCSKKELEMFESLPFENKFILNNGRELSNDTIPFPGKIVISKLLNKKPESYPINGLHVEGR